jgi:N-acetylglucosaminyldiphosphoundecaprenol N-acetyl-beta-D-mannosaminyltransferase
VASVAGTAGCVSAPPAALPQRVPVVGTPVSLTSYDEVLARLGDRPPDRPTVVACCNVHSVMTARRDTAVAHALRSADIATPDGVPLVWALRRLGRPAQQRVYGPDLMRAALREGVARGWRHYLYGATPDTLARLVAACEELAPGVVIAGTHAPPFRPETPQERTVVLDDIRASGADMVWVGLGMPKQELWITEVANQLPGVALLGVGAAFDLLSGTIPQAPPALQRLGLEWAFRLVQEPRRLWRRYVVNNPAYLLLLGAQLASGALRRRAAGAGEAA